MVNTEALLKAIADSGLKMQSIAKELDMSRIALWRKSRNVTKFRTPEVDKLCKVVGIRTKSDKDRIFYAKECD